ncbi:hypothetical protein C0991_003854 [Blastosporella zonata]|nr:hypothetical protein C0991_003854 [Blastosporella zonata]
MASLKRGNSTRLRQTILSDSPIASVRASSSGAPIKRKRNLIISRQIDSDSGDDHNAGIGSIKFVPNNADRSSDEEEGFSAPKRRKTLILDSDDSDVKPRKTRLRRKASSRKSDGDDDDAEKPRRRKLKKKHDIVLVSSDDEDLAEEVEKERIITSRLRTRDKKTAFQKNLEKLKRRKQGKPSESSSSEGEEEEESGSEDNNSPFKGARPSSGFDSLFDEESSDHSSNFIVEDDNSVVAVLPMEFSMESHEDLDHKFKKIFQFFVHIAVRPAKERHHFMQDQLRREEYFSVPLRTVRRELSGLRDSLVASSVWRPEFKKSLGTYPNFDLIPLDFAVPSCDACHLGGRVSTLIGRLTGLPYDPLGFEIKDNDDSDNSDSESDDGDTDKLSTVDVHLGRFCARRTRVYHEFTHWEYTLFQCIREELDALHENHQSNGFFRMAYAGGLPPPDDLDDADGICDWLDQRKVIDMEWMKVKNMMESARHLELERKRGGEDD